MNRVGLPFYAKLAFVLLGLVLVAYIAITIQEILGPLYFSFLFSVLLLPVAESFEELKVHRGIAALLAVILLILLVSIIIYFITTQITSLLHDWPLLKAQVLTSFKDLQSWIYDTFHINPQQQMNYINNSSSSTISKATNFLGNTFLSLSSTLLFFVFIPVYTFFMLFYRSLLVKFIVSLFDERHSIRVYEILSHIRYIIKSYVVGLFIEMLTIATISCVIFLIFGIKYATLLGALTGLFNIIPYIGIFTAIILCMSITFAAGSISKMLLVGFTLWLLHVLDSNFLMPRIVGSKVRINALVTIVGVILGNLLWGISGMFLAIPTLAILKIIFDRIEGLEPWGILLGDDTQKVIHPKQKKKLPKKRFKKI